LKRLKLLRYTQQFFNLSTPPFFVLITRYQSQSAQARTKKAGKGFVRDIEKATQLPPMFSMFPEG